MARQTRKRVAFISSYPPRRCGIATFSSDLVCSISAASEGQFEPLVVAMRSDEQHYDEPVKFEIRQNVKKDYISAADYINFSHVDLVSVQHEFGLFGGEAGSYLNLLLNRLKPPVITTLHTVIQGPSPDQHKGLADTCDASYKVITMNERGVGMLREIYGISEKKIGLIPHGIPDLPFVDSNYYKHKFGMEERRTILTFGLLSRNKGIEVMLEAMPTIIQAEPSVLYVILGMTHPEVLKDDGESYRFRLQRMVKELGLEEHVIFHNRFVKEEELRNFLCATDVYTTPYLNVEQLTSGTLSFAVGTGKAVVSTPYWAATELLADGRGKLAPFGDSKQMAAAVIEILKNDSLYYSLRRKAFEYGRSRTWPKIGEIYWELFKAKELLLRVTTKPVIAAAEKVSSIELPEPSLVHLKRLTDDTGLLQHAKFTVPNREEGYSTDDNARALIAMTKYYTQYPTPEALRLFETYLSFVLYSQTPDGGIRNLMDYNRCWRKREPAHDALGRVLWALGTIMAKPPSSAYLPTIKDCFDNSIRYVEKQHSRGLAYSILGMANYLIAFPGASDIKRLMAIAADKLAALYQKNSRPDWQWFEEVLSYDNAVLPHALFVAGFTFGEQKYFEIAERTCEFLLSATLADEHFSFIGCVGWYKRGGKRACFDQQPIEAAGTIMMLRTAYDTTQNIRFLTLQRKAFDWFLGANDLCIPIYNFRTQGCHDGLGEDGVNLNQGAESIVSFLLGLLAIIESYAIVDKVAGNGDTPQGQPLLPNAAAPKEAVNAPVEIKSIPADLSAKADSEVKKGVDQLA
jgi:glycosyltransferase involved in cell wall biosynthesis